MYLPLHILRSFVSNRFNTIHLNMNKEWKFYAKGKCEKDLIFFTLCANASMSQILNEKKKKHDQQQQQQQHVKKSRKISIA